MCRGICQSRSLVNVGACLCKLVCQSLCQVGQASQLSVFLFVFVSPSIHSCKFKIFKKNFFVFGVLEFLFICIKHSLTH